MENENIIQHLNKIANSGSDIEQKIINYIINYPKNYWDLQASEIATECYISNSSITKFVKKLGFKNFNSFKSSLISSKNQEQERKNYDNYLLNEYANDVLNAIIGTVDFLCVEDLDIVAQKIVNAERIFISGIGGSGIVANDLRLKLFKLGLNAYYETDEHLRFFQEQLVEQQDTIYIYISYSGPNHDQIELLKRMQAKATAVILITANQTVFPVDKQIVVKASESFFRDMSVTARVSLNTVTDLLAIKIKAIVK